MCVCVCVCVCVESQVRLHTRLRRQKGSQQRHRSHSAGARMHTRAPETALDGRRRDDSAQRVLRCEVQELKPVVQRAVKETNLNAIIVFG